MSATWLLLCAAIGIDAGWQRLADGGYEYIIQIEPHMLDSLIREKYEIVSEVPAFVTNIRSYRIRIGEDELPRDMPPPNREKAEDGPPAADSPLNGPGVSLTEPGAAAETPSANATIETTANSKAVPAAAPAEDNPRLATDAPQRQSADGQQTVGFRGQPRNGHSDNVATAVSSVPLFAAIEQRLIPMLTARPWLVVAALTTLILSLSMNLFLTWMNWGERSRYRTLVRGLKEGSNK